MSGPITTATTVASRSPSREFWRFVLLALGISWSVGIVGGLLLGTVALGIGALVPGLVALWLTRLDEGSTRSLWAQITRWRLPAKWYAAALGVPAVVMAAAYVGVTTLGGSWSVADPMPLVVLPVWFLLTVLLFGGPEEPGWRGYALPRLQCRYNALVASFALGAVWSLWHAPLWLMPDLGYQDLSYPLYVVQVMAMCIVFTWLFNSTGGSVLLAVLMHAAANTSLVFLASAFHAQLGVTLGWCVVAAVIVVRHGVHDLAGSVRVDRDGMRRAAALPP